MKNPIQSERAIFWSTLSPMEIFQPLRPTRSSFFPCHLARLCSATGSVSQNAGEVIWSIGSLANGAGGERRVTVQVNAEEGDLLEVDGAYITGTDSSYISHKLLVDRVTRVEDDERPSLAMGFNPIPVEANEQLDVALAVTNSEDSSLSNVELILRYPNNLNNLYFSDVTTGGESNTLTGYSNNAFHTGEMMIWTMPIR